MIIESVGTTLRHHRETRRMSLAEVSRVTRIPLTTLEAIEQDHFDDLPGEVFVKGFLKSYAQTVGLVPDDVVARYSASRRIGAADANPLPVASPVQAAREGQSRRFGVAIALVLLLILFTLALSIVLKPRGRDMPPELAARAERARVAGREPPGVKRIESAALLVRSVAFGEADLIVTFFTETDGKLSAVVRGARRSTKRFGGALEPIHELYVSLDDKGKELCVLKEARVVRPREGIVSDLDLMDAAGRALRWVRHLCPARTPEPAAWESLRALLDVLDARLPPLEHLAVFGLGLLADVGYAIDFERCVRCGKPCPEGRPAFLDAAGGGLVCMTCGGARRTISAALRALALRVQARDARLEMTPAQANELIAIIEDAMSAHADFDPHSAK